MSRDLFPRDIATRLADKQVTDLLPGEWRSDDPASKGHSDVAEWLTQDGRIRHANSLLSDSFGQNLNSILGDSPIATIPSDDQSDFVQHSSHRQSDQTDANSFECRIVRPDCRIVFVQLPGSGRTVRTKQP